MAIRKYVPLLAPLLALVGLLTIGGAGPVLADPRPSIVSITLDANNHAVVTWSKEPWQGSMSVKWSTGDGTVAAPYANWDTHYGLPLVDCYGQPLAGNPYGGDSTKGQWNYGQHCKGQDVAGRGHYGHDLGRAGPRRLLLPGHGGRREPSNRATL